MLKVLICGAGPTGLMLASQLAMRGIPFRIIDKSKDHTTQSRALVVHARTLEIFDQMQIADIALSQSRVAKAVNMLVQGKRQLRFNLGNVGEGLTKFPFLLILEQFKTERILADFLAQKGHTIEREIELIDFTQHPDKITAVIKNAAGKEETITADWIIGTDGSHSFVRQKLNIPFHGKMYSESLYVLDCKVSFAFPDDEMYLAFADTTFTAFFPMTNGRCRVLGLVPRELEGKDFITFDDVQRHLASNSQLDVKIFDPAWISMYHSHHRAVSTFRMERGFVAGDAAHIHSPVGAQGMNTGLQDAYNLAWKLAMVCDGKADPKLLDSYGEERFTVAHNLVRTTDRAFHFVTSKRKIVRVFRVYLLPYILKLFAPVALKQKALRERGFKTISEIGIEYRKSSLSKEGSSGSFPSKSPKPGDRIPYIPEMKFKPTHKFQLILFTGSEGNLEINGNEDIFKNLSSIMDVKELPFTSGNRNIYKIFGIANKGYYLIRPDQYIAFRNSHVNFDVLHDYLKNTLLLKFTVGEEKLVKKE